MLLFLPNHDGGEAAAKRKADIPPRLSSIVIFRPRPCNLQATDSSGSANTTILPEYGLLLG